MAQNIDTMGLHEINPKSATFHNANLLYTILNEETHKLQTNEFRNKPTDTKIDKS